MVTSNNYYQSHLKLPFIGKEGQVLLQKAKVLVIGAGGLGCPCLQYLSGCGIGTIGIADFDTVSESNLHRQFLYTIADIGRSKAIAAVARLSAYNPHIQFNTHDTIIAATNVLTVLKGYDVIVDCTDNFTVRYLINDACVMLDKPLVYGAIHQAEGQVTVFNYKGSPTLRSLFPIADDTVQSCADIGAYNIITGIIGVMMANEVIKILLNDVNVLAGKLGYFDALIGTINQLTYAEAPNARQISIDRFSNSKNDKEISPESLHQKILNKENFLLIDVRTAAERAEFNIGGEHIPLDQFLQAVPHIPPQTTVIVYCQSGERSLRAVEFLLNNGFLSSVNLQGGIRLWKLMF